MNSSSSTNLLHWPSTSTSANLIITSTNVEHHTIRIHLRNYMKI
uniref:Uncharacterized protein n=1 Tax=Lepeophtheirus salmonis TaxID=72036 RepID=A0A0K2UV97_LEPSM